MSAIWGAIDLSGKPINKEVCGMMRSAFEKCVIDRYEELYQDNVYMGCGIQYFTPEASAEVLPVHCNSAFFTADVVLDNRTELLERLHTASCDTTIPDGELLFRMYQTYGSLCLNDLLGAYTFVWYDKQLNQIELVLDAVGNRCLYYRKIGQIFYFSSLIEPLAKLSDNTSLNDRWLTDFLAMDHLYMINETQETPLMEIYRIAPAQHITVTEDIIEKNIYWKPFENFEEYHFASDDIYREKFCSLWEKAVTDTMRTDSEIAIQLSGGLDSTAVAAIAAPYLKKIGKKLHSYTSVPMKDYQYDNSGYYIEDETEDVLKTAAYYGNIETEFITLGQKTPWELAKEEYKALEIPYKSVQNFLWLSDSMQKAYQKGARIMLSGSYGNTSISFTDLNVYMNTLYSQKKRKKLKKEIALFAQNMGFSPKYAYNQIKQSVDAPYEEAVYPFRNSYVNRAMTDSCGTRKRLSKMEEERYEAAKDFSSFRSSMVLFLALRQIGETTTKHSLATGVLPRDPTKDKRIIEFCIHLPLEQFCKEGIDRRLVKVYLKDIIPPHVIRFGKQGKQSADLQYRFAQNWENTRAEWISLYEKYSDSRYVNTAYARRQLLEQTDCREYSSFDLTRHMYTLFVLQYEAYITSHYPKADKKLLSSPKPSNGKEPLVSVIIPVYNVENYLTACVESVCSQTYRNLEILLIDDGSTDNSGTVCDSLAAADNRIQVIHKLNEGVSIARNTGLNHAKGDFLSFVDSDDCIDNDMYSKLIELLEEQEAELAICGYKRITQKATVNPTGNRVRVLYGNEVLDTYITSHDRCYLTHAIWNRIYRRSLIEYMYCPPSFKYEDSTLNANLIPHVTKAVYTERTYYNYYMRSGTLSHALIHAEDITALLCSYRQMETAVNSSLEASSKNKYYFDYYCFLLDIYCKASIHESARQNKRILAEELHRIRKLARLSMSKAGIGRLDYIQLLSSTYFLPCYPVINHLRRIKKKLLK